MLPRERDQRASWPDLQQRARRFFGQNGQPVREAYGLAEVLRIVSGVRGLPGGDPCPRDIRNVGNGRRAEAHAAHDLRKRGEDGIHHCGVEGM